MGICFVFCTFRCVYKAAMKDLVGNIAGSQIQTILVRLDIYDNWPSFWKLSM